MFYRQAASRSLQGAVGLLLAVVVACTSQPPPPPTAPATPTATSNQSPTSTAGPTTTPQASPPQKVVGSLDLEECDPARELPCLAQAVRLSQPIVGTGVALTFSTEWAKGRIDRPAWDASALGLGGWSLDVLQRYDPEHGVLLSGDGSWRIVEALDMGNGERAVPSFDGLRAFIFDDLWRHVRTLDDITGATLVSFAYDSTGRLTSADGSVDGGPIRLSVMHDTGAASIRLLGIAGAETRALTNEQGDLTAIVPASGGTVQVTPGSWGLIESSRSSAGNQTTFSYDDAGRLASSTDADGVATQFDRTTVADGFEVHVTTSLGRVSTVRHQEIAGTSVRTFTTPSGLTTRLDIEPAGSRTVTYPDGTVVSVGYQLHPRWGAAAGIPTPYVERRPDGTEHREEIGAVVASGPGEEPYGRPWHKEVLVDGQPWVQSYDPTLRRLSWADPAGRETSDTFDEVGRIIARVSPGEPLESYTFDADGRLLSITQGSGSTARVTSFAHDTQTGEVRVTRPDGLVEGRIYNRDGLIVRSTAPDGSATGLTYDSDGRLIQLRYGDHPSTTLGYSAAGRQTAYLPPGVMSDAGYELRTYDQEGNMATIAGPGDRSVGFTYDNAGRAASWRFDRGEVTAEYDPVTGYLVRLAAPGDVATTLRHAGRPTVGIAWTGPVTGEVSLTLDAGGRLAGETVNGEDLVAYARDAAGYLVGAGDLSLVVGLEGLPTSSTLGVVDTVWTYDGEGRLTEAVTSVNADVVHRLTYERDSLGRISAIERTGPDGSASRLEYRYDQADRVAAVMLNGVDVETYSYDDAGNRISVTRPAGTVNATYDDRDRLLTSGAATYEYAGDGALAARRDASRSTLYDYDDLGSLRSATLPDGRLVEYIVDGSGLRLGRIVDGILVDGYLYRPGGQLVAATDGDGAVVARYAYDDIGRLEWMARDGRTYRIVTDHLGSPVLIIDVETGAIAQQIEYDAWGVVLTDSNPGFTPFGFAGGLQDPDTGLVQFQARDYDPATGRWTAPDPIRFAGGDPNLYRYVGADPINNVDPTGLAGPPTPREVWDFWYAAFSGNHPDPKGNPADWRTPPAPPAAPPQAPPAGLGGFPTLGETWDFWYAAFSGNHPDPKGNPADWRTPPAPPPAAKAPGGGGSSINVCIGDCSTPGGGANFGVCLTGCTTPGGTICKGFCAYGEPHLRTGDGRAVDFQSAGEFTLSRSPDKQTIVQARQETPTGSTTVTLTRAVAMLVAGDRVGIYADKERPLIINGEIQMSNDVSARLAGGGVVERHGSEVVVDWPDGSRLIVQIYASFMNYDLTPSATLAPLLTGVLGNRDGTTSNDLTTSTGVVLDPEDPAFFDRLHHEFADSWRITQTESLFDYLPGETTETFTRREIPTAHVTLADLDAEARQSAETLCRAVGVASEPILSDCILDFGLTGDPSFASGAASVAAATSGSIAGPVTDAVEIILESLTTGQLVDAAEVQRYRFTATAGQIVYLDAQGDCVEGLSWRLLRPDGTLFDLARTCTDLGRDVLSEAGDWTIEVFSDAPAVGMFAFTILPVLAATQSDITLGEAVTAAIEDIGAWHRYRLTATAGQIVYIDAHGDCVEGLLWRLLRPNGTLFDVAGTCNDIGREVLAEAGGWIIEVFSDTASVGSFAFTISPVPAATQSDITVGAAVSGAVDAIGAWHRYRFTAAAGQIVFVDAQGGCVEGLLWRLLRPDDTVQAVAGTCNDLGRQELAPAGDWIIEVFSDTTALGSFAFTVLPDG